MFLRPANVPRALLLLMTLAGAMLPVAARAGSCKTQSQMTAAERDALSNAARTVVGEVQSGDVQALRANTIPAEFGGISGSVDGLKPLVQRAVITVDSLYALDNSTEGAGAGRADFYCGTPVVVLNFNDLPRGTYALAILHATGVPQPQQISLILSETSGQRWMLGGFSTKPILETGHDGLWYWVSARKYAQRNMNWDAWFYYRIAAYFLNPVEFLSSPNFDKLQHEEEHVHPTNLPAPQQPLMIGARGSVFQVNSIDTTATFGALDLEVHYTPDSAQAAQLHDPPTARKQVTALMTSLLTLHPELHDAFHGIWVLADGGSASLFSLELPMDQIGPGTQSTALNSNPAVR